MQDCKHLIQVELPTPPNLPPEFTFECEIKRRSVAERIRLSQEETKKLRKRTPPNDECHFITDDKCELCIDYQK